MFKYSQYQAIKDEFKMFSFFFLLDLYDFLSTYLYLYMAT